MKLGFASHEGPQVPIQAVTFDVGGTLLTPHPSVGAIYARTAARHGSAPLEPALVEARFRTIWGQAQPFEYTRDSWQHLVGVVFDGLVPREVADTFFPELYEEFARATAWRVFDDVLPTLEALAAQGLDLGIISNWDERLRPLLRETRIDRYFNCLVISSEAGFSKPSSVVFEEALRQLGQPAGAVLHVGDGLREDFAGATAAGMRALLLRRDAPPRELQIQSLLEICGHVQGPRITPPRPGSRNFLSPDG